MLFKKFRTFKALKIFSCLINRQGPCAIPPFPKADDEADETIGLAQEPQWQEEHRLWNKQFAFPDRDRQPREREEKERMSRVAQEQHRRLQRIRSENAGGRQVSIIPPSLNDIPLGSQGVQLQLGGGDRETLVQWGGSPISEVDFACIFGKFSESSIRPN